MNLPFFGELQTLNQTRESSPATQTPAFDIALFLTDEKRRRGGERGR